MMTREIKALLGSALPMLLIGSLQTDTSMAAERPDFSGTWQLNEELSENPQDEMMEKMGDRGGRGGGRTGGSGMGAGGMRGGGGRGSGGGSREGLNNSFQQRLERVKNLEVLHQDPRFVLNFADGFQRTLFTDGREVADDLENGLFEATAKWKSASNVVVTAESTTGEVNEIYELSEDGEQLFVTTKMEGDGRRPNISFTRVYDRTLATPTSTDESETSG